MVEEHKKQIATKCGAPGWQPSPGRETNMWRCRRYLLPLALVSFSATTGAATAADKIGLQLAWEPQFQFAGYYAALWQGYYREAGLAVDIRPAVRPDRTVIDAVEEVGAGRAEFGVGTADILLGRERGLPLAASAACRWS